MGAKKRKAKNAVLKTVFWAVGVIWVIAVSCMDSVPNTGFFITTLACTGILAFFAWANKDRLADR